MAPTVRISLRQRRIRSEHHLGRDRHLVDLWSHRSAHRPEEDINPFGLFALGALLGVIGIVIVLFLPAELPKAPNGMLAVKCPRCTTVQNVRLGLGDTFECWQCKAIEPVAESF